MSRVSTHVLLKPLVRLLQSCRPASSGIVDDSCVVCTRIAIGFLHNHYLPVLQLVDLADSALSGKIQHIPDNMYDLDADWEIDPKALTLMEKIGVSIKASTLNRILEQWANFQQAYFVHFVYLLLADTSGIMYMQAESALLICR